LIKRQEPSRVGNTRIDQSTFNPQEVQPTCKFGTPTPTGGKPSRLKERTLSTQEEESLMLLEELTMKTRTSSLLLETTR
jgi:hypothetical protein